ncbi:DUF6377 domain-containing protein [Mucilaginibacter polytrichastri]|uniref:DUF6377 domain-containing protein n=1 Tax=Mucilaginibacter polytrichastri TaxID=1302689 RepID=A0A1Q5ZZ32_9SPHI|nr:DUF6377 domain-containing protein [Mucilaginibacter polytrichastri]OKS87006.1 hypothetical protein RG47T_2464 [Mucilaginibacter polytrichastri]SFS85797.1 hypothetical protein SAMN04487890_10572 [Mucilaginibacter polytrichastri]
MKILLSIYLVLLLPFCAKCNSSSDSLLSVLKSEISRKKFYDGEKNRRIRLLKQALTNAPKNDLRAQYVICDKLYTEYKDYLFDSAHVYTKKLLQLSNQMHDLPKQYESKIKLGTIQLSWGMFKETFDCLNQISVRVLPDSIKLKYYELKSTAYSKQASYNTDVFYSPANRAQSIRALDSVIILSKPNTFDKYKYTGELLTINGKKNEASVCYKKLLLMPMLTDHQRAMVANDLSSLTHGGEVVNLRTRAAIYDIRSSTKETLAIFTLGKMLFQQGNIRDAELLLVEAKTQAQFYGNRLHKTEVVAILTTVSAQKLINSEREKISVLTYLTGILGLAIIGTIIISVIVRVRLNRVRLREMMVQERNQYLDKINKKLLEDAHIKEEYIGYFFEVISGYILKLEKIKRSIERKAKTKNYDELLQVANEINIKQERYNLFYTFDNSFLKLFPNFISTFNSLLKPEDQIWPKDNEILNTNLRIFALMRLGIKDNQTIANILESAVSTIYTYKIRIKSKALFQGDDFENKIMDIKFVDIINEKS